jgi:diguanylate cyclase (GGDEF)-like protein
VALVGIDLDRFSLINDTLGRSTGDEVLREVGSRLAEAAPTGAVVSHSNGDEFAILLRDATPAQVLAVAERALAAVRRPIRLHRQEVHLTACAGLAMADSSRDLDDLARDVDIAVHAAKRTGADSAAWCDDELRADVARRARVERDLRRALAAADQLRLHYQPSFSLVSGAPTGVEALLRWHHPLRGPVPPAEVIPVAEESGLILPLGEWVMGAAAAQAAAWRDVPQFTVWCNVAPRQLVSGDVPGALTGLLARTGLPPHRLGIEVTESVLADGSPAGTALEEVRRLGVRIAIDDFGTGYSSLSRLLAFPVDIVKIDRSFVTACETPAGRAVLEGVVNLAHGIGATTIAEGVETWEQLEVLRQTPCDAVTGFLLGKPVPAQEQALRHVRLVPPRGGPRSPAAVGSRASR